MSSPASTILIMAAGTGGHVFPALSIARALEQRAAKVHWLGTPMGMENDLLRGADFPLHHISVSGLRGSGLKRKLLAPFMLLSAFFQSIKVLKKIKPDCVLGMGGFICGPAGLASWLLGMPLVIHEQNAVAGLTNKILSRFSSKVLEAFPKTFPHSERVVFTGNPVRKEILSIDTSTSDASKEVGAINLLVLGGSQGAAAINKAVPELLAKLADKSLFVIHQTGKNKLAETKSDYQLAGLEIGGQYRIEEFVADMAAAYQWADLVICRSGASTVSELAVAGLPSLLIPYPYHKDNQQFLNALWLEEADAAIILPQDTLDGESLAALINEFIETPKKLELMRTNASRLAIRNAADEIAEECLRFAHV